MTTTTTGIYIRTTEPHTDFFFEDGDRWTRSDGQVYVYPETDPQNESADPLVEVDDEYFVFATETTPRGAEEIDARSDDDMCAGDEVDPRVAELRHAFGESGQIALKFNDIRKLIEAALGADYAELAAVPEDAGDAGYLAGESDMPELPERAAIAIDDDTFEEGGEVQFVDEGGDKEADA